jgi:two-component system phosphate regulon response regulator PhoB
MTEDTQTTGNGQKKILLVEDDDALANVYMMRLEAEGFTMMRASNGEEALTVVKDYRPDLVILDVMMPKVSGFEVLDILRNTPETADVKIMMLSALGQEGDKQKADDLGANDYLVKSQVVITDVIGRVRSLLGVDE